MRSSTIFSAFHASEVRIDAVEDAERAARAAIDRTDQLPTNEIEIEEVVDRAKFSGVAGNQIRADSPRSESNQNIEMKLSGLVDIVSFCPDQPADNPT